LGVPRYGKYALSFGFSFDVPSVTPFAASSTV
jgi:hypothetical protein